MTTYDPEWESPRADEPVETFEFPVGPDLVVYAAGTDDFESVLDAAQDDRDYWNERYAEAQEASMRDEWC